MEDSQISMKSPNDDNEVEQVKSWIASGKSDSFEETANYNVLTMIPPKISEDSDSAI